MPVVVILALIASIYVMKRKSVGDAVIDVYLPVLLLIPGLYALAIPHVPAFGFADMAILPIGFALLLYGLQDWKFQRADLWVLCFFAGKWYAEYCRTTTGNANLLLYGAIIEGFIPYMIGKLLLERAGMRERFVRRFVLLMVIVAVCSLTEFRLGLNLFTTILGKFFPGQNPWLMQVRGGFVRIAGPYSAAILAGMVFLVGMLFSLWVGFADRQRGIDERYFRIKKPVILTLVLLAGLYMTNSRGPWVGAVLGFLIANIGRAKNVRRAAIVTALLCAIGGTVGYIKAEQYTSGSIWEAKTVEQEDAIYRRQLLDSYKPIVEKGGLFGWGVVDWPKVPGMSSIDNEFLFLQITQGEVGFWTFLLLSAEAAIAIFRRVYASNDPVDIGFALSLGGAIAGLLLSLTTVYMGAQSFPLFFLLIGWSQALVIPQVERQGLAFRRVFA